MRIPKYRKHSNRNYAIVEHQGERHRLPGKFNSPESLAAYAVFIKELGSVGLNAELTSRATIGELIVAYLDHAMANYSRKEYLHCKAALDRVSYRFADLPASQFGPVAAGKVRDLMIYGDAEAEFGPWARKHINLQMGRVRRMFRWASSTEAIPASVWHSLKALEPLKKGRSAAKETDKVHPVDFEEVNRLVPFCSPTLVAMLGVQMLTGMRSENVCLIRGSDIDRSGNVWRMFRRSTKQPGEITSSASTWGRRRRRFWRRSWIDRPMRICSRRSNPRHGDKNRDERIASRR